MSNLIKVFSVLIALCQLADAQAVPLSDIIVVEDREWAQPVLFAGVSRSAMDAACPEGVCMGSLGGISLSGWRWADADVVGELFNFYIGDIIFSSGAPTLHQSTTDFFGVRFYDDGWLPTPIFPADALGPVTAGKTFGLGVRTAYIAHSDFIGLSEASFRTTERFFENAGGWFYRERASSVSAPATGILVLGNLCLLLTLRRGNLEGARSD